MMIKGLVKVSGEASKATAIITRPNDTTAYAINDVVGSAHATNLEFLNIATIIGSTIIITGVSLEMDATSLPTGTSGYRLHIYNEAPTAIADNVSYNLIAADRSKYLGNIILDAPIDLGDTLWSDTRNINMQCKLTDTSNTLYGVLETLGAYTPVASTIKRLKLNVLGV